jgi:TonB family protein
MSTLLPREHRSVVNTNHSAPENRHADVDYLELCMRQYPAARRRAVLSVVPGLGQLRNGEVAKGSLFLLVMLANLAVAYGLYIGKAPASAQIIYIGLIGLFVAYAIREAYDRAVRIIRDQQQPPKFALTLPEAASGSYLAHAAMMGAFLLAVLFMIQPPPPTKQITNIELVAPDKPKPPAPAKKEPKRDLPKPKAEVPKPIVEKPVVKPQVEKKIVEPPKPMPVAVSTPTTEPTPFSAAPVVAAAPADTTPATSSGGGTTGGVGTGGGDGGGGEVDMGPWMREMQRRIKKSWFPPKGNESKRIKVTFKVTKDGVVHKVKLLSSSGVSIADDAAIQAINDASPFTALPDGVGDEIDINFTFDYNVFGAKH